MAKYTYDALAKEYQDLWDTMHIIRDAGELQRVSDKIKKFKDVYEAVQKDTGVPWEMIVVIHLREAGESDIGRWKGVLHNGELIVGTGRKTKLVPANKGPFNTWHEAAVDALKAYKNIKEWPASRMLWALEPFNGYGYRLRGIRSPYLWASTNHQQPGKFVSDGVFSKTTMDTQVGCAAMLRFLGVAQKAVAIKMETPAAAGAGTATGTLAAGAVAAYNFPQHIFEIGLAAAGIAVLAWLAVRWYKKDIQPKLKVDTDVK